MTQLKVALFLLLLAATGEANNAEQSTSKIRRVQSFERVNFELFAEYGSFDNAGTKLEGQGLGTSLRYAFSPQFAISFAGAQAYANSSNAASLYTVLRSYFSYPVYGEYATRAENVFLDDKLIIELKEKRNTTLSLTFGASQYFFNGTSSVTPGSGLEFYLKYDFQAFDVEWTLSAGIPLISIGGNSVSGFLVSFGPNFVF